MRRSGSSRSCACAPATESRLPPSPGPIRRDFVGERSFALIGPHRCTTLLAMAAKDDLGRRGEDEAVAYLTGLGYRIVERNWRCRVGEIDIVALDGTELVIAEVKTRSGRGFGDPLEGVDPRKLTRLCVLAGAWRRAHRDVRARTTRIDLIGVLIARHDDLVHVDHLRAAA